jgi:hypothetical protein
MYLKSNNIGAGDSVLSLNHIAICPIRDNDQLRFSARHLQHRNVPHNTIQDSLYF